MSFMIYDDNDNLVLQVDENASKIVYLVEGLKDQGAKSEPLLAGIKEGRKQMKLLDDQNKCHLEKKAN